MLYHPGDAHTVSLFWRESDYQFTGYYIDLLEPFRRTPVGFDTRDHVLDIWVQPDRVTWDWKDEDELAWHIETGRMSQQQADAVRTEGTRAVMALLQSDVDRWRDWTPDPLWPVPVFPPEWRTIFAAESL
jgi:predicted RNA-binding protein associated with RNAse of E/G family